jgi:hypothetical protein
MVTLQDGAVGIVAYPLEQLGRSFDIGEQKRDGAGRQRLV